MNIEFDLDKGYKEYCAGYKKLFGDLKYVPNKESFLKKIESIKKAMLEKRLMIVAHTPIHYSLHYIDNNRVHNIATPMLKYLVPYRLNKDTGHYTITVCETSRALEIIMSTGYKLGLQFNEINQNQIIVW